MRVVQKSLPLGGKKKHHTLKATERTHMPRTNAHSLVTSSSSSSHFFFRGCAATSQADGCFIHFFSSRSFAPLPRFFFFVLPHALASSRAKRWEHSITVRARSRASEGCCVGPSSRFPSVGTRLCSSRSEGLSVVRRSNTIVHDKAGEIALSAARRRSPFLCGRGGVCRWQHKRRRTRGICREYKR